MNTGWTARDLIAFEEEVAEAFKAKKIRGPIHLSGGNEEQLIEIFKDVEADDWVFSTWRSHYHALLKGVPRETVMADILAGKSMMLHYPQHRFLTSAIVGGILPIACGVAAGGHRVWCFVGDMCASIGAFRDAKQYASGHNLRVTFAVEDNWYATNTPTAAAWGDGYRAPEELERRYLYERTYPHCGVGEYVAF